MANETLQALDAGDPVLGAWVESTSARAAEVLAADLAWVGIDMEHTPVGAGDVEPLVRAVEHGGATPVVRLPSVEYAVARGCKLALDAGAGGVIVPRVETAAQTRRVVDAAKFPPEGDRGVAGSVRANDYGGRFREYVGAAGRATLVAVQLETAAAVERADDLLAVEGLDVAFVGENDLSASLGVPGETDDPAVVDGVRAVRDAAEAHGVHLGAAARDAAAIERRVDAGFRFLLLGGDLGLLRRGLEEALPGANSSDR